MRTGLVILLITILLSSCKKDQQRYLVISKIQNASKLATTETVLDKIVFGDQQKKLLWVFHLSDARFVAYTKAIVWTGIDLSELQPNDIKIENARIEIMLPHVKVLDFQYPFSKFRIDTNVTDNAFLNTLDVTDYENFYQQAQLDIWDHLSDMGIKEATENKTRILLTGLLKNLGYEEIYIRFKEGKLIEDSTLTQGKQNDQAH